jgi:hypothetical protein
LASLLAAGVAVFLVFTAVAIMFLVFGVTNNTAKIMQILIISKFFHGYRLKYRLDAGSIFIDCIKDFLTCIEKKLICICFDKGDCQKTSKKTVLLCFCTDAGIIV